MSEQENLYDGHKGIVELDTSDLTKQSDGTALPNLNKFQGIVYMLIFYAPWCGFCHQMADDVKDLAKHLHDEGFLVGAVNCERNSDIDEKIQINGFPTVYFVKDDKAELYDKGRDLESMVSHLCETLGKCGKKK
jgi:thiol-disulfide isomerase/thioredoxin